MRKKIVSEDRGVQESFPINDVVKVMFNKKNIFGLVKDKEESNHPFYGLVDKGHISVVAPFGEKSGVIKQVLTDTDQKKIEGLLGMKPGDLSVHKREDNFWRNFSVRLNKDVLELDLSDPYDYIKYRILLANDDIICPRVGDEGKSPEYRFVIHRDSEANKLKAQYSDLNIKAWAKYGEIANDKGKMVEVLRVISQSAPGKYKRLINSSKEISSVETLKTKLAGVIQDDLNIFLDVVEDPHFNAKLLISNSILKGSVTVNVNKYYVKGDKEPFANDIFSACEYIDVNQEFRLRLEKLLKG